MAFEYKTLTAENRAQMLQQRQSQFEQEHYNHEMNKIGLSTMPDGKEKTAAIAAANAAQATIETAIQAVEEELAVVEAELPAPETTE